MLNYEPEASLRATAKEYHENKLLSAQPEKEAKAEEETAQPEKEVVETEEEELESEELEEEEEEEEDDEETQVFQLKVDGVILEKTMEEVTELAQMGMDYTKKTQALSEKVKTEAKKLADEKTVELDKRRSDLIEATDVIEQFYSKPLVTKEELDKLLDEGDIEGHVRAKDREEGRQELIRQVKGQRKQAQEDANKVNLEKQEQLKREQIEIVLSKLPELKAQAEQDKLESFLKGFGYKDNEIGSFIYNANNILLASDAMKYRELVKKGIKQPKPKAKAPNLTKKAGNKTSKSSKIDKVTRELSERFKQTGNLRDAARLHAHQALNKK